MKFRRGWVQPSVDHSQDAAANTNTTATYFGHAPMDVETAECWVTPRGSLTAHSSNYATVKILQGSTEIASLDTDVTSWVAGTPVQIPLTGSGGDVDVAEDECWNYTITKAGTGVQVPALQINVTARPYRKLP
jgi:hypothetical protein